MSFLFIVLILKKFFTFSSDNQKYIAHQYNRNMFGTSKNISASSSLLKTFIRGKKKTSLSPSTQKVVNQLSALSASRKQPKLINLCNEDLIKHQTITNAWKVYQRKKSQKKTEQLKQQYESIYTAMEDLKTTSPELFEVANTPEPKKRFPLEMRAPSDYPANKPWIYNYSQN